MKTVSQVLHLKDCPETLDEAREIIAERCATIQEMISKNRELLLDRKRLDWLEANNNAMLMTQEGVTRIQSAFGVLGESHSVRAALDAAMENSK